MTAPPPDDTPDRQLRLLGAPALLHGDRAEPFPAMRQHVLLCYLACRGDWVRRDELADLFFPGRDAESARSNLRKVVFLARKVDGVALEQHGELLRWAPASDLARFERAFDERRWADALATHGGDLMLGLDAAWPPQAIDWLDAERARVQARWHEAATRRLAELANDPAAARTLAEAMLRQDPLDDVALQALGRAQQALGLAGEAEQSLDRYRERLSREVGVAPSVAIESLRAELRGAATPAPVAAPLVGRRQERAAVLERLARADCRVLTLLGPPGVGKSTLARAVQRERGGAWVPLEDLVHADQVPARAAGALGLALDSSAPPWAALAQAIGAREALLVLDNAEHLALAGELGPLLAAAPQLKVLAASRAPLGMAGEWRLSLDGLPLPDPDETDPEVLEANDAVRLFVQRASPLAPAFDLAAEAGDVVRLVHEVDGLPLAIELLAAWRRLMPVAGILAELAQSLEVLEPSSPQERSVQASFARSWQRLGAVEQRVLAQLAVLPAPVDRELLRSVLRAPLPVLAALADQSLLQADGGGRFTLHPLIRRCAAPLASDVDVLLERHARHLAHTVGARGRAAAGDDELPHLRAAWRWATAHADAALLHALTGPYARTLQRRASWREGQQEMQAAAEALRPQAGAAGPALRALALVTATLAELTLQCGDLPAALATAEQARQLARDAGSDDIASIAARHIGAVHWQRGDYVAARRAFMERVELLSARPGAETDRASAETWVGLVDRAEGRFDDALQRYGNAVQVLRQAGRLPNNLYLLNNLGNLLRSMGRLPEALAQLQEGLQLARAHQSLEDEPYLLTNIARVHEDRGDVEAARQWADRAVASAATHGEPLIAIAAHGTRARALARATRTLQPALADVWDALSIAGRLQTERARVEVLANAAFVLVAAGDARRGAALADWACAHPQFAVPEAQDLRRLMREFMPQAPADATGLLPADAPWDAALDLLRRAEQDAAPRR